LLGFLSIYMSFGLSMAHGQVLPKIFNKNTPADTAKKTFDLKEFTQGFPKIIKKNPTGTGSSQERKNIELRQFDEVSYLRTLSTQTDALLFQNTVDLARIKSIISEDPFSIDWAPTNEVVAVADQVQIDSVWITAFE
ncbi:MAG: hypothetical protein ACO21G_07330, partial [Algoriphagus sp.]